MKAISLQWLVKFGALCCMFAAANITQAQQQPAAQKQENFCRLTVKLPMANAKLYVSGILTKLTGTERKFESPDLKPGVSYVYEFRAMWEPNNYTKIYRSKRVFVKAGGDYVVDLTVKNPDIPDDITVRYVPTPHSVVEAMCKLGKVKKGDVVFDLGCGDGRFVIAAVKKFGAVKGTGVDIDPQRIKESRAGAEAAGVTDRVTFRQGDVLKKIDGLEEATVVMLYMGNDINLRLRPHLKKRLKPGSRVVSHRFHMGDWEPDRKITVKDSGTEYNLLLWVIRDEKPKVKKK